ncbi:MAG TPA: hypothetical protein VGE38_07180 [Nocardioides sp.]|uniref:hypothetical protein n=1 Tax=Nocardioides sp. TaxID=35761 RepID=UPI002ED8EA8D
MRAGRGRRPKIAQLLGQPGAEVARQQIATARSLQVAPTLYLEIRLPGVTYLYDDPQHPERRTGEIHSPPYTRDDRALLLALEFYEGSLCRCGIPISVAWHSEMDGFFDVDEVVCHACSARAGRQVAYTTRLRSSRNPDLPMPEYVPGRTITTPDKGPTGS